MTAVYFGLRVAWLMLDFTKNFQLQLLSFNHHHPSLIDIDPSSLVFLQSVDFYYSIDKCFCLHLETRLSPASKNSPSQLRYPSWKSLKWLWLKTLLLRKIYVFWLVIFSLLISTFLSALDLTGQSTPRHISRRALTFFFISFLYVSDPYDAPYHRQSPRFARFHVDRCAYSITATASIPCYS